MKGIENLLEYIADPDAYIDKQKGNPACSVAVRDDWDDWAKSRARHYLRQLEPATYTAEQAKAEGVPVKK